MFEIRLLSSLEKVFLNHAPEPVPFDLQGLRGETLSFQLAFRDEECDRREVTVRIRSPHADWVRVRQVRQVPVSFAQYPHGDGALGGPGLYPDLLEPLLPHRLHLCRTWSTLWLDVTLPADAPAGAFSLTLELLEEDGRLLANCEAPVEVLAAQLPPQRLIHTRWFHCDSLAEYYGVEVFSPRHWELMEHFLRRAVRAGINMILTPVHTPPLDTRVGGERLTVQLVGVTCQDGRYRFDMSLLRRWIDMCKRCGVRYYEVAHLYTQWGAAHAPKIMGTVDGVSRRLFGWETDACSEAYRTFLEAYIPALRQVFREEGVEDCVYWHISDEPSEAQLDSYRAAAQQVAPLLAGCTVMDALSNFAFYQQGIMEHPVVATDHIAPFLAAQVPDLWAYYCCGQCRKVSNTFIALPSVRNRVLGMQLFRSQVAGFLQWGYNFYSAQYSDYPIDPFASTDADGWVPAGDPFVVYPGADGQPMDSLRLMVTAEAFQDLRALELLAALTSREFASALIDEELGQPLDFETCPEEPQTLLRLRARINQEIAARS